MIRVGQIITTHGHKGEVKVYPLTDDIKRYENLEYVFLELPGGYKKVHIEKVRFHKNAVIIKFKEIEDMNNAEKLRNIYLNIEEDQLIKLPPEHYFIFQIVGLDVYESENYLGKVKKVIQTGSNDVYIVKDKNNKEILIPALKSVVKKIDLESKRMLVKLPEGLMD